MRQLIPQQLKAILIASIGGGLEIYDFTIYVFFAPILGSLFFPSTNHFITLLNTFGVFAIGYFARPLGAIIFGHFGDKLGRKRGMLFSIVFMAVSTMGIGLLPTHSSIGILAPILLVFFRFIQGFAVGGDLPGALTFVSEFAGVYRRGLFCSFVYCAVNLGLLLATLVSALLTSLLSHEHLVLWGWRVAFLLGLVIALVGFYLRTKIPETPQFEQLKENQEIINNPLFNLLQMHLKPFIQSIGLVWLAAVIISQLFLFMPTYLNVVHHMSLAKALNINSCNVLIFSVCILIVGYISDKIGRRRIIFFTSLLFIIFTFPLYLLLVNPNFMIESLALICFAVFSAGIIGTVPATLTEMFSTEIRYSGVAISYNIGYALFAGFTPVIATYLLYKLPFQEAPCLNLILSAIVALIVSIWIKENERMGSPM